jgi:hypothetical protein
MVSWNSNERNYPSMAWIRTVPEAAKSSGSTTRWHSVIVMCTYCILTLFRGSLKTVVFLNSTDLQWTLHSVVRIRIRIFKYIFPLHHHFIQWHSNGKSILNKKNLSHWHYARAVNQVHWSESAVRFLQGSGSTNNGRRSAILITFNRAINDITVRPLWKYWKHIFEVHLGIKYLQMSQ